MKTSFWKNHNWVCSRTFRGVRTRSTDHVLSAHGVPGPLLKTLASDPDSGLGRIHVDPKSQNEAVFGNRVIAEVIKARV